MRILLSNDDGFYATGLTILRRVLEPLGQVVVVAPEGQRSASGHAITMHKPLYPRRVDWSPSSYGWRVNGTPADCVKLGIGALLDETPDLVLSGINHGSNLGKDVFYSGTVSAAVEAMLLGVPAMALSLDNGHDAAFEWAAQFIRWWITGPDFVPPPPGTLYNINFPDPRHGRPRVMKGAPLGQRDYANEFQKGQDPHGREYYWISGERIDRLDEEETDVALHHRGFITLTPLSMNWVNESLLARLPEVTVPERWG